MRIAIPVKGNKGLEEEIETHFGRAQYYIFVDIEDNQIKDYKTIETPFLQHGPGDIPNWLNNNNAHVIISQGMGRRAVDFFNELGIKVFMGINGKVRDIVDKFINDNLVSASWDCGKEGDCEEHS